MGLTTILLLLFLALLVVVVNDALVVVNDSIVVVNDSLAVSLGLEEAVNSSSVTVVWGIRFLELESWHGVVLMFKLVIVVRRAFLKPSYASLYGTIQWYQKLATNIKQ